MATKKAPIDPLAAPNLGDADLDRAIDDLRGVLKTGEAGGLPDTGFDMDFASDAAAEPMSDFGSPFESTSSDLDSFGGGDFGAGLDEEVSASPFGSETFGGNTFETEAQTAPGSNMTANLDLIMEIPIDVQIVLGSSRMQVSGLMNLTEGATIALDRKIGEPVDIVVNGRLIGRGEITVLEEDETRFGVKLIEIKGARKV